MLDGERRESIGTLLYCSQDDGTEPSRTHHDLEWLESMHALDRKLESPKDTSYMHDKARLQGHSQRGLRKPWNGAHKELGIRLADGILKRMAICRCDENDHDKSHILIDSLG